MIRELIEKLKFAHDKSLDLADQCTDVRFTIKQLVATSKSPEEKKLVSRMQTHADELCRDANRLKHMYKKQALPGKRNATVIKRRGTPVISLKQYRGKGKGKAA